MVAVNRVQQQPNGFSTKLQLTARKLERDELLC